jgi:hypothetical protein
MSRIVTAGLVLLGSLGVAGCNRTTRDAEAAEKEYAIVDESGGSPDERCAAARKVAAAWLKAQDRAKWQLSDVRAELDCNRAAMARSGIG